MAYLEFSPEEIDLLREVLQQDLTELDLEIFRTDTHDFKVMLKRRREVLDHIMSKLSISPAEAYS